MAPEHHDLHHEFPEHAERIHALKTGNAHFAKLFEQYHSTTREIEKLEGEGIPVADESFEELKRQRLSLKDQLFGMLSS